MKKLFGWYLPLTEEEITQVWDTGIFTVDANVLLDLYRYHDATREALLETIRAFRGRLFLSRQASEEFIRNRMSVVAASAKSFDDADKSLKQLEKALKTASEELRSNRLVPRDIASSLTAQVSSSLKTAQDALSQAQSQHPNYFENDAILAEILELFDGVVGDAPSAEERKTLVAEAERRRREKIPPGYMDADKEGDRAAGDYVLWTQVLQQAKKIGCPMILVTSERKEDWWEKHGGRRSPRIELRKEAAEVSGQKILIYETEHFLKLAAKRSGEPVAAGVVAEVRAVGMSRIKTSGDQTAEAIVHSVLERAAPGLMEEEAISGLIAETNASGYYPDEIEVESVDDVDLERARLSFSARITFSGDQDSERMWAGDSIAAEVSGTLQFDGSSWELDDYEISAEISRDGEDGFDEYEPGDE